VSALPEHLRAVVECVRGRLGARLVAKPGTVGLLLVAGHPVPERVMVESTVLGARVGVVTVERAKELAAIRNAAAAARLDDEPPVGNRWVMLLDNDLGVYLLPFTVPEQGQRGGAPGVPERGAA
jgi:hypothetical protein